MRSDTITRPSDGMRQAMANAEVGDDGFRQDPSVNLLEEKVARLLNMEGALFVPSGTMANQIGIGLQCGPGDELICERNSHIMSFEGGGASALWGAATCALDTTRGQLAPEAVGASFRAENVHYPKSRLVCIENSHARAGGSIYRPEQVAELGRVAGEKGLALHIDGARLWNAANALSVSPASLTRNATSVAVCLSKGLGAPVGSMIATSGPQLGKARWLRKRLGGGMRQAGVLAAAGIYALDHNYARLAEDNANAKKLGERIGNLKGIAMPFPVETNIVLADFDGSDARQVARALTERGLLCLPEGFSRSRVRFLTNLHVTENDIDFAAAAVEAYMSAPRPRST